MRNTQIAHRVLFILSALYGLALLWRYSFVVGGARWFCPADDVWITMSYARTLAETGVLAWHPLAQACQGFSSWAWVLILAPLEAIKASPQMHGLFVQLLGWLVMCATVHTVGRLATVGSHMAERSDDWGLAAMALIGFNWPLWNLAIQGWEHSAVALCVAILCVLLVSKQAHRLAIPIVLSLTCLLRTEAAPIALAFGAIAVASKRVKWWHVLLAVGSPLAIQAIASLAIYGDPLPNTYYLKMTGYPTVLRLTRGAWETARDILRILPLFALILLTKNRWKWPVLAALATAVWLGGDAWHTDMTASRYVLSVLPLLLVYGALVAVEWIPRKALWPVVAVAILAFSPFPRLTLIEKANHYQKGDYRTAVAQGLWTSGRKNVTTIGVVAAGIIPYVSRKVSLDILGKSDTIIAKMPMHRAPEGVSPLTYFNPGHLKWDARYTAAVQRPLVVWQIWGDKTRWRAVLESCGYELRIVSSGNDTWPVFVR